VRRGDTLVTIADRFGVSLSQLRSWNGIPSGVRVAAGRRLRVAEPATAGTSIRHRRRTSGGDANSGTRTAPGKRSEICPATHPGAPTAKAGGAASPHKPAGRAPEKSRSHAAGAGSGAGKTTAHKPTHKPGGPAKASQ